MSWAKEIQLRLSIIIANHNYGHYVGETISSALAVDWHDKEVIVVDDASTDDSKNVIDRFGNEVKAYFRPKSHQLGTHRFGFDRSTGDILIFLDADDLLEPDVMHEVSRVWRPGVSKVQFRMYLIGADGSQLGTAIPQFPRRDNPKRLRRGFLRTMAYTTPPGSGNAYRREFVGRAYAMAPPTMRWSDDVLLTLAPIFGDVLTIQKALARYRLHGTNYTAVGASDGSRFRNQLGQDIEMVHLFSATCRELRLKVPHDPLSHSMSHLQCRFASYLTEPASHPFPCDTMTSLLRRLAFSVMTYSQMPLRDRAILLVWALTCALAPQRYRQSLVLWRFAPTSRPATIRKLLAALGSLRSPRRRDS
jgi:hypothetical protein